MHTKEMNPIAGIRIKKHTYNKQPSKCCVSFVEDKDSLWGIGGLTAIYRFSFMMFLFVVIIP